MGHTVSATHYLCLELKKIIKEFKKTNNPKTEQ